MPATRGFVMAATQRARKKMLTATYPAFSWNIDQEIDKCGPPRAVWPAPGLYDTQLSKSGLLLELHSAQIANGRVPAFGIVEALDVVEYVCSCFVACPVRLAARALGLQRQKRLPMAALSHTLPDRLIEQTTPLWAISR